MDDARPLLVFFTSERSGPARRMESLLAHLARKERTRLRISRVDVDSRDLKGVAVWNTTADQGVNRSDALGESLRRAGAGRVLRSRGETPTESDSRQAKSRRRSSLGVPTPGSMPPSSTIA